MTTYEDLVDEHERVRIGQLWLHELHQACREVSARYSPAVYAVAESTWTAGELDDLVQDVVVGQLLEQGQLRYILDVARSLSDIRRLVRHVVRRALVARRRRTVVDRLLERIGSILDEDGYELLEPSQRFRPVGTDYAEIGVDAGAIQRAANSVRMLPTRTSVDDRADTVYRTEVLREFVRLSFTTTGTSLSKSDFGQILREVLTPWLPVVLDLNEGHSVAAPADAPAVEYEGLGREIVERLDERERLALRLKLGGASDSSLATQLNVSRPTAAKCKAEAFSKLADAWRAAGADGDSELIAREVYLLLCREEGAGRD